MSKRILKEHYLGDNSTLYPDLDDSIWNNNETNMIKKGTWYQQMEFTINIKKLKPLAKTPTFGSEYAAGCDLYACLDNDVWIAPHQTVKIDTGLAMELPIGYFGGIFARSGLATKQGLRPANCVGVIDSDYRGSVIVALHNDTDEPKEVKNGDRIAQLVLLPCPKVEFRVVNELNDTERGNGGFGSTGSN